MSYDELWVQLQRVQAEAEALRRENEQLQQEREQRQLENAELRQQVEAYEHRLAEAQALIAELQRQLYGPKSERLNEEQQREMKALARVLEEQARREGPVSDQVLAEEEPQKSRRQKPRRRRAARHPFPPELEVETVTLEPDVCPCPQCGRALERIGEEVTEEIDEIPAKLIRRRIVRPKYACRCGEAGVTIAALPERLIPQGKLGLGLAVHIVLARFDDHLSYYSLERQFLERHGVVIARQQMVQWVEKIAFWLQPVYDAIWQNMRAQGYLQIDETPVRVLDPEVKGKAARGYLWFFAVPGGDVILLFDRSRGLEAVRRKLEGFTGTIQTDAYEVYLALERRDQAIERIACLAHARRRFYEAAGDHGREAVWFLLRIGLLYRIEDEIRDGPLEKRKAYRLAHAPQIWEEIKNKAEEIKPRLLPKSSLGKAVNYFLNEYEALIGYLRDGRYEIDNNLIENNIRPTAVGRKRWLFIGHPDAGWRSAVIYSILISCRRRGINTQHYLTDVLRRLPTLKYNQIQSLLPGHWKPPGSETS